MAQWILAQAKQAGGQISPAAARSLAHMLGTDTRTAYHEVQKLLAYVGYQRSVEVEDVETLSIPIFHERIFALVDAMAAQDGKRASGLLRKFLEEEDPGYVMAMIVRTGKRYAVACRGIKRVDVGFEVIRVMVAPRQPAVSRHEVRTPVGDY